MTQAQIDDIANPVETVPALKTKSIWGHILSGIGLATEVLTTVAGSGVVPPHAGLVLVLVGNLLGLFGRLNPDIKPIAGIVNDKN